MFACSILCPKSSNCLRFYNQSSLNPRFPALLWFLVGQEKVGCTTTSLLPASEDRSPWSQKLQSDRENRYRPKFPGDQERRMRGNSIFPEVDRPSYVCRTSLVRNPRLIVGRFLCPKRETSRRRDRLSKGRGFAGRVCSHSISEVDGVRTLGRQRIQTRRLLTWRLCSRRGY
jgi:hypothetical protein